MKLEDELSKWIPRGGFPEALDNKKYICTITTEDVKSEVKEIRQGKFLHTFHFPKSLITLTGVTFFFKNEESKILSVLLSLNNDQLYVEQYSFSSMVTLDEITPNMPIWLESLGFTELTFHVFTTSREPLSMTIMGNFTRDQVEVKRLRKMRQFFQLGNWIYSGGVCAFRKRTLSEVTSLMDTCSKASKPEFEPEFELEPEPEFELEPEPVSD